MLRMILVPPIPAAELMRLLAVFPGSTGFIANSAMAVRMTLQTLQPMSNLTKAERMTAPTHKKKYTTESRTRPRKREGPVESRGARKSLYAARPAIQSSKKRAVGR